MKNYIAYNDCKIGYIRNICRCKRCQERGEAEIFIRDLDGEYLDCVKLDEIQRIIYLGDSLEELFDELKEHTERELLITAKKLKYAERLTNLYTKL